MGTPGRVGERSVVVENLAGVQAGQHTTQSVCQTVHGLSTDLFRRQLGEEPAWDELFGQEPRQGRALTWPDSQSPGNTSNFIFPLVLHWLHHQPLVLSQDNGNAAPGPSIEGDSRRRLPFVDHLIDAGEEPVD